MGPDWGSRRSRLVFIVRSMTLFFFFVLFLFTSVAVRGIAKPI